MSYSFMRSVELKNNPDYPLAEILVEYDAEPERSFYETEMGGGGVTDASWNVLYVRDSSGRHTEASYRLHEAHVELSETDGFDAVVLDWCKEDWAQRGPSPWPDEDA